MDKKPPAPSTANERSDDTAVEKSVVWSPRSVKANRPPGQSELLLFSPPPTPGTATSNTGGNKPDHEKWPLLGALPPLAIPLIRGVSETSLSEYMLSPTSKMQTPGSGGYSRSSKGQRVAAQQQSPFYQTTVRVGPQYQAELPKLQSKAVASYMAVEKKTRGEEVVEEREGTNGAKRLLSSLPPLSVPLLPLSAAQPGRGSNCDEDTDTTSRSSSYKPRDDDHVYLDDDQVYRDGGYLPVGAIVWRSLPHHTETDSDLHIGSGGATKSTTASESSSKTSMNITTAKNTNTSTNSDSRRSATAKNTTGTRSADVNVVNVSDPIITKSSSNDMMISNDAEGDAEKNNIKAKYDLLQKARAEMLQKMKARSRALCCIVATPRDAGKNFVTGRDDGKNVYYTVFDGCQYWRVSAENISSVVFAPELVAPLLQLQLQLQQQQQLPTNNHSNSDSSNDSSNANTISTTATTSTGAESTTMMETTETVVVGGERHDQRLPVHPQLHQKQKHGSAITSGSMHHVDTSSATAHTDKPLYTIDKASPFYRGHSNGNSPCENSIGGQTVSEDDKGTGGEFVWSAHCVKKLCREVERVQALMRDIPRRPAYPMNHPEALWNFIFEIPPATAANTTATTSTASHNNSRNSRSVVYGYSGGLPMFDSVSISVVPPVGAVTRHAAAATATTATTATATQGRERGSNVHENEGDDVAERTGKRRSRPSAAASMPTDKQKKNISSNATPHRRKGRRDEENDREDEGQTSNSDHERGVRGKRRRRNSISSCTSTTNSSDDDDDAGIDTDTATDVHTDTYAAAVDDTTATASSYSSRLQTTHNSGGMQDGAPDSHNRNTTATATAEEVDINLNEEDDVEGEESLKTKRRAFFENLKLRRTPDLHHTDVLTDALTAAAIVFGNGNFTDTFTENFTDEFTEYSSAAAVTAPLPVPLSLSNMWHCPLMYISDLMPWYLRSIWAAMARARTLHRNRSKDHLLSLAESSLSELESVENGGSRSVCDALSGTMTMFGMVADLEGVGSRDLKTIRLAHVIDFFHRIYNPHRMAGGDAASLVSLFEMSELVRLKDRHDSLALNKKHSSAATTATTATAADTDTTSTTTSDATSSTNRSDSSNNNHGYHDYHGGHNSANAAGDIDSNDSIDSNDPNSIDNIDIIASNSIIEGFSFYPRGIFDLPFPLPQHHHHLHLQHVEKVPAAVQIAATTGTSTSLLPIDSIKDHLRRCATQLPSKYIDRVAVALLRYYQGLQGSQDTYAQALGRTYAHTDDDHRYSSIVRELLRRS